MVLSSSSFSFFISLPWFETSNTHHLFIYNLQIPFMSNGDVTIPTLKPAQIKEIQEIIKKLKEYDFEV